MIPVLPMPPGPPVAPITARRSHRSVASRDSWVLSSLAVDFVAAGVPTAILRSRDTRRKTVAARRDFACQAVARGVPMAQVARWLGMHHTSICYYVGKQYVTKKQRRARDGSHN